MIVVRFLLVPALVYDVGRRVRWPTGLTRREELKPERAPEVVGG